MRVLLTLLIVFGSVAVQVVQAQEPSKSLADEVFELWNRDYTVESNTHIPSHNDRYNREFLETEDPGSYETVPSFTPNLDQLMGRAYGAESPAVSTFDPAVSQSVRSWSELESELPMAHPAKPGVQLPLHVTTSLLGKHKHRLKDKLRVKDKIKDLTGTLKDNLKDQTPPPADPVPEPGSLILALSAGAATLARRRLRRSKP